MKNRIAEIVTKFRAEGLPVLRAAIKQVADAARQADRDANRAGAGLGRGAQASARQTTAAWRTSFRDIGGGFQKLSRDSSRTFANITRDAGRAGKAISRALSAPGRGVAGLGGAVGRRLMQSPELPFAAYLGAGAAAIASGPVLKGGLAFGAAIVAGIFTALDASKIRAMTESLGISPEVAGQWQIMGARVGVFSDDIASGMEGLKAAMVESLDPASEMAKLFSRLGVPVRDAAGNLRNVSHVMFDVAESVKDLNAEQKAFALGEIFGADAQKLAQLIRLIGEDRAGALADFERNKKDGLFASQEDLDRVSKFQKLFFDFLLPLKALARELFLTFEPFFSKIITKFDVLFRNPEERARIIQQWFVKPFQLGLQLLNDFLQVFLGFDLRAWLAGFTNGSTPIISTWLFTLKKVLSDIWSVGSGLLMLFLGIGKAVLNIARAIDGVVIKMTGFSIESWIKGTGAEDVEAFLRDLGKAFSQVFKGPIGDAGMTTPLGKYFAGQMEEIRQFSLLVYSKFEPAIASISTGWAEYQAALSDGSGLANATTVFGKLLIMIDQAVRYVADFSKAFYAVFVGGQDAPAGFEFLDGIKSTFDYVLSVVREVAAILTPLFSAFDTFSKANLGMSGPAALITGKLGLDVVGKLATPQTAAIGAVAGGAWLATLLKDFFVGAPTGGSNDANRASMDADYDRSRGKGTEQVAEYDRPQGDALAQRTWADTFRSVLSEFFDARILRDGFALASGRPEDIEGRNLISSSMRLTSGVSDFFRGDDRPDDRAAVAREAAAATVGALQARQAAAVEVVAPLGKVDVTATGTPVVINLPTGGQATGIYPPDQAAMLQQALSGMLGGR